MPCTLPVNVPHYVSDNLVVPARILRSNDKRKIKLQCPKGALYRNGPLYRGSMLWDKLDAATQNIVTHRLFMAEIKQT